MPIRAIINGLMKELCGILQMSLRIMETMVTTRRHRDFAQRMEMLPQLISSCRLLIGSLLVVSILCLHPCSAEAVSAVDLALRQSQIADRYRQLETMLLKMAEYDASTNPRRAALLRQTLAQGQGTPGQRKA